jgi:antitoxin (DNA-binding transcriptional repressor) of toxin-antitoxin stability system
VTRKEKGDKFLKEVFIMSQTVSVSELKNNTHAVMQMVKNAPVVLKHAGKPIAQIIPLDEKDDWYDEVNEAMTGKKADSQEMIAFAKTIFGEEFAKYEHLFAR